ncbi:YceD family protein [Bacillus xiapuensis]|uniref:YceD family protein n=1 Tax=Bacillus xiapuensis TaxID=2014075 RepID=UPI000C24F0D4|nr:YceD family protein [Bacillus xiapuensis]
MKWSIIQLQKLREKGLILDELADMQSLKDRDPQIRDITPVHVTGKADISPEKVTFHLQVEGQMILPCSRTLVDVEYPFDFQMTETFLLKPSLFDESEDEESLHKVQGDVIDLAPVLEEAILLEVPMQVFSEDADQHLIQSGKGWEYHQEEQLSKEDKKVDPRLAGLADFFKSNEE